MGMTRPTISDSAPVELLPHGWTVEKVEKAARAKRRGRRAWLLLLLLFAYGTGHLIYACGYLDGKASLTHSR